MQAYHITVSGKVQGVSFRSFAKKNADLLGISGFCRNMEDGTVEAVAAGDKEKIDRFLAFLKRGPHAAVVEKVDVKIIEIKEMLAGFEIRKI